MSLPTPTRAPSLQLVISNAIKSVLLGVHTSMPGTIKRYDPALQVADVQPSIQAKRLDVNAAIVTETLPIVPNVPVVFPSAGGFRITFPVAVGDSVLLVFAESSIDVWSQHGTQGAPAIDPQDTRRHSLSDAICIPGLNSQSKPWTGASATGITIGKDGGPQVVVRASTVELGGNDGTPPTDFALLGSTFITAFATFIASTQSATTAAQIATAAGILQTALGGAALPSALAAITKLK